METSFPKRRIFAENEQRCERLYYSCGPYWHITTPGEASDIIFRSCDDYALAVMVLGLCSASVPGVKVIAYAIMSNHIHLILSGDKGCCLRLFESFRQKLTVLLRNRFSPESFNCGEPIEITDLTMLRNEICYVNRNGYVVCTDTTPFSYLWTSGIVYFNPWYQKLPSKKLSEASLRKKREITHMREPYVPDNFILVDGVLSPISFCDIEFGMNLFRDCHHYFSMISKNHEANSEIAKRLGDKIVINDEELYGATCSMCSRLFGVTNPKHLSSNQKIDLAKQLHYNYNASNQQVRRVTGLDISVISELFPMR